MSGFEKAIQEIDSTVKALQERKKVIVKLNDDCEKRERLNNDINDAVSYLTKFNNYPALKALLEGIAGNKGNTEQAASSQASA